MNVAASTAYMDEADGFDWLIAMDDGKVLATGTGVQLRSRTGSQTLEGALIVGLPQENRRGHHKITVSPRMVLDRPEVKDLFRAAAAQAKVTLEL